MNIYKVSATLQIIEPVSIGTPKLPTEKE